LRSIEAHLGTDQYPRLRVGVGRGDGRRDLADHVLARFEPDERAVIDEAVSRAADAIVMFIDDGIQIVMSRYNRKEDREEQEQV
jgi:PTH1 family peptidyl-tRNA hydrolase